jgi:hypothetical protein
MVPVPGAVLAPRMSAWPDTTVMRNRSHVQKPSSLDALTCDRDRFGIYCMGARVRRVTRFRLLGWPDSAGGNNRMNRVRGI